MKKILSRFAALIICFLFLAEIAHASVHSTTSTGIFGLPIENTSAIITCGYLDYAGHYGYDLQGGYGTAIYAPFEGQLQYYRCYATINGKKQSFSYGNYLILTSTDGRYQFKVCHMSEFVSGYTLGSDVTYSNSGNKYERSANYAYASIKSTQVTEKIGSAHHVNSGDYVGKSGSCGFSTGPHLHIELRVDGQLVNPDNYFTNSYSAKSHFANIQSASIVGADANGYMVECVVDDYDLLSNVTLASWAESRGTDTATWTPMTIMDENVYRLYVPFSDHGNVKDVYYNDIYLDYGTSGQRNAATVTYDHRDPQIQSLQIVGADSNGYMVECVVNDYDLLSNVTLASWAETRGTNTATWTPMVIMDENVYRLYVPFSDHGNVKDMYYNDVYFNYGLSTQKNAATLTYDHRDPAIQSLTIDGADANGYMVKLVVNNSDLLTNVTLATWAETRGTSTATWVPMVNVEKNVYKLYVPFSDHADIWDMYYNDVYFDYGLSTQKNARTITYDHRDKESPAVIGGSLSNVSSSSAKFSVTATDNIGVDHVNLHVWSGSWTSSGETIYHMTSSGDTWSYNVPLNLSNGKKWTMQAHVYDAAGNEALVNSQVPAYAEAGRITVTFNADGGSCSESSRNTIYSKFICRATGAQTFVSKYGTLPTPQKNGYEFDGWYTASEGGTKVTAGTLVTNMQNHTLYARWNPVIYDETLTLPDDLTTIDSQAFEGVSSVNIVISDLVTNISADAFDDNVLFVCPEGSYAEYFAIQHGIPYVYTLDE